LSSLVRRPSREGDGLQARRVLSAAIWILASSAAATLLARALVDPLPSFPFLFAIVVVAVAAGRTAGLVEVALSVVLLDVAVLSRFGSPRFEAADILALLAFAAAGCAVVLVIDRGQRQTRDARRESDRLAFLAGANEVLEESLDYEETLRRLARYVTPAIADWCVVHLATDDDDLRPVAIAHQDPEQVQMALDLQARYPVDPASPTGVPAVVRSGRPEIYEHIDDEMLVQAARDQDQLDVLRRLGMRSVIIAPLRARDRTFGALTLVSAESGSGYDRDDLRFVMELARRASLSIDTIRSYELARRSSERNVVLQRLASSLSRAAALPDVVGAVLEDAVKEIGARAALVATLSADGTELRVVGQLGHREDVMERWARFPVDAELPLSNAVRERRPVVMETLAQRDLRYPALRGEVMPEDHAVVCLPMLVQDHVVGGMSISFPEPRTFDADAIAFLEAVTTQTGQAMRRASLYEAERSARVEAERANERLRLIADASAVVNERLGFAENLSLLAELLVRRVADVCVIDVVGEDGDVERVAAVHRDPTKQPLVDDLKERYAPGGAFSLPIFQVMRAGEPAWSAEVDADFIAQGTTDDEHARRVSALGFRSYMSVPLRARGRIVGALSLISTDPARPYGPADVGTIVELGGRAAMWIENARLYEDRDRTARTLQQSLLPLEIPAVPELDIAAGYWPAGEGNEVGGDFYDVFEVLPGTWLAIMGDVCGRGPEAAAVMGIVRHAAWALGGLYSSPSRMLEEIDRVMRPRVSASRFCTACIVRIEVGDGRTRLSIASAGHPLPVLVRPGRKLVPAGTPGSMLGIVDDPLFADVELDLGAGEALVLYTDGVSERGHENVFLEDDDEMASAIRGAPDATGIVSSVEAILSRQRLADDAAVLAIVRH
jgi:GAF domain-containing protein